MADSGYDYEVIGEDFDDLYCQICLKLMKDAVQLECGHGMCYGCLQALKGNAQETNIELKCPKCRNTISTEKVMKNFLLNQVISSVRVKCQNFHSRCEWKGRIYEMPAHLTNCEYELVSCCHDNCEETSLRFEMKKHEKCCGFQKIICEFCQCISLKNLLEEHYKICENVPIPCPNQCSDELFVRKKIESHLLECENELISCDFLQYGCSVKMKRVGMNEHLSKDPQHLLLLMKEQKETRTMLETFHQKSSGLEKMIHSLTNQDKKNEGVSSFPEIKDIFDRLHSAERDIIELKSANQKWMENGLYLLKQKVVDSVKISLLQTKIEGELLALKHHSNILKLINDFKDNYGVLQGSLEKLQETVDYEIFGAVEEINLIFEPLKLKNLVEKSYEKIISEFGYDADTLVRADGMKETLLEEVLVKCDDPLKTCSSITQNLEKLKTLATYAECISKINERGIQVAFRNDFVVVLATVAEAVKLRNIDIELQTKEDMLVLRCAGNIEDTSLKVVKLHSQTKPKSLVGTWNSNMEWVFGILNHLIDDGFVVDNISLLTLHSLGNPSTSDHRRDEKSVDSHIPQGILSIIDERFDVCRNDIAAIIDCYDQSCDLLIKGLEDLDTVIATKIKKFHDEVEDELRKSFKKDLSSSCSVVTSDYSGKDQVYRTFHAPLTKKQHRYLSEKTETLESFFGEVEYNKRFRKMVVESLSVFDNIVWKAGFAAVRCKIVKGGKKTFEGGLCIYKRGNNYSVDGLQVVKCNLNSVISVYLCNHNQATTLRAYEKTTGCFTFPISEKEMKEKGYMVNGNIVVKFVPETPSNNRKIMECSNLTIFVINKMKDACSFHNIMVAVEREINAVEMLINEIVCSFDEAMEILNGRFDNFSKDVDKKIKASLSKLRKIIEPIQFVDMENMYETVIQELSSTCDLSDLDTREKICGLMNDELNEISKKTQYLKSLHSVASYEERFNALLLKKLPQENVICFSNTMVVFKCHLKESKVTYRRFALSLQYNRLYLDGVTRVKMTTVMLINQLTNTSIQARKMGSQYVFPIDTETLKKDGYLLNETVVIVMTK